MTSTAAMTSRRSLGEEKQEKDVEVERHEEAEHTKRPRG
jgi:hypothetical protein